MPQSKVHHEDDTLSFHCSGCQNSHSVRIGADGWAWNGSIESPTITPSVLATSGHYSSFFHGSCWCTFNAAHPEDPSGFTCQRCHSYITEGKIQYLSDCSHGLAGQTLELSDWVS